MISTDGNSKRQPLYRNIYRHLVEQIHSGSYLPGDRIPSEKELSRQFKVSRITTKHALEILSGEGKIVRVPGKGSFVAEPSRQVELEKGAYKQPANLIGCIMADFDDSFGVRVLQGIERRAGEFDFQVALHLSRDVASEEQAIDSLLRIGTRGIIIMPCHGEHYNSAILKLVLDKFPLVFVDRNLRGLAASSVATDNVAAARLGVNHLIELGHRSICFVSSSPVHTSTIEERLEGFVESHAEHAVGIDQSLRLEVLNKVRPPHHWTIDQVGEDVERVCKHLRAHGEITAVFAAEFAIARIVEIAAAKIGKRVPEDLSIVCFDTPMRYDLEPHFTHLRQQEFEMGAWAAQLAYDHVTGSRKVRKVRLDAELIRGTTTASPPDIS